MVEVPPHIVTCAVRYALGRSSYVVGDVCDLVIRLADDLGEQRAVICEDVRRHLADQFNGLGRPDHDMDRKRWEGLFAFLSGADHGSSLDAD